MGGRKQLPKPSVNNKKNRAIRTILSVFDLGTSEEKFGLYGLKLRAISEVPINPNRSDAWSRESTLPKSRTVGERDITLPCFF